VPVGYLISGKDPTPTRRCLPFRLWIDKIGLGFEPKSCTSPPGCSAGTEQPYHGVIENTGATAVFPIY